MITSPNGHPNPAGLELCGDCGALIEEEAGSSTTEAWHRRALLPFSLPRGQLPLLVYRRHRG